MRLRQPGSGSNTDALLVAHTDHALQADATTLFVPGSGERSLVERDDDQPGQPVMFVMPGCVTP